MPLPEPVVLPPGLPGEVPPVVAAPVPVVDPDVPIDPEVVVLPVEPLVPVERPPFPPLLSFAAIEATPLSPPAHAPRLPWQSFGPVMPEATRAARVFSTCGPLCAAGFTLLASAGAVLPNGLALAPLAWTGASAATMMEDVGSSPLAACAAMAGSTMAALMAHSLKPRRIV
ncbi:hypothetical protein [Paraburkholderia acidisoli]|uniref:hypothetical protein n=1 Tax=Paraburkholderia acidisoli TaxID=2571748 RepID=UPI0018EEFE43|nr:hypothetical protein [Paraburkholderia acidisoli]